MSFVDSALPSKSFFLNMDTLFDIQSESVTPVAQERFVFLGSCFDLSQRSVVELEKEMFIMARKARFNAPMDSALFLAEFAGKLRQAKACENFSENLLKFCIQTFSKYFVSVYLPIDRDLTDLLSNPDVKPEDADNVLDRAMCLLRSWKNLENDIPDISARAFLSKVELLEKWRTSKSSSESLSKSTSSPNLTLAQQCFHRYRYSVDLLPGSMSFESLKALDRSVPTDGEMFSPRGSRVPSSPRIRSSSPAY